MSESRVNNTLSGHAVKGAEVRVVTIRHSTRTISDINALLRGMPWPGVLHFKKTHILMTVLNV